MSKLLDFDFSQYETTDKEDEMEEEEEIKLQELTFELSLEDYQKWNDAKMIIGKNDNACLITLIDDYLKLNSTTTNG